MFDKKKMFPSAEIPSVILILLLMQQHNAILLKLLCLTPYKVTGIDHRRNPLFQHVNMQDPLPLDDGQLRELQNLLNQYSDIMQTKPGRTHLAGHNIETGAACKASKTATILHASCLQRLSAQGTSRDGEGGCN